MVGLLEAEKQMRPEGTLGNLGVWQAGKMALPPRAIRG
jgi:hypothetical protein